jgi:pSer/pThr/pTyr-binding forkhead associated (FHA) protein
MDGISYRLPWLWFAIPPVNEEITTLGDESKVHQIPEDLVVLLRVLQGAELGKGYQITETPLTIGRDKICTISINDSRLSRQHAGIYYLGPDFFIKDLASTNGVFVNARKVKQIKLNSGDQVQMGSTLFEFIVSKLSGAKK